MDPPQGQDEINSNTFYPTSAILVSPWIWLTFSILVLCGLLFVSFRKQRAVELWNEGKQYLRSKLEELKSRSPIRLPTGRTTNSNSTDSTNRTRLSRSLSTSSSISSNSSNENNDDDELLPFSTTVTTNQSSIRYASFQRRSRSMFENLKENVFASGKQVIENLGWNSDREYSSGEGGLKRLLMGKRDVDRELGRIRLGGENLFELGGEDEEDAKITSMNR
ncbi:hypothetical protein JCM3765_002868 [Sporobolomyces pararoseus]